MQRSRGYILLACVFLFGAVAGGGGALAWAQQEHATAIDEGRINEHHRLRALTRKLDLDRNQESRVSAILASDGDESRVIGRDMIEHCGQRLRQHKVEVDDQIRTVLRPDQQRRFDRMGDERRHRVWLR